MAKYKGPRRPAPLKAVLQELESALARFVTNSSCEEKEDMFIKGCHAGYIDGLKRAIGIVNYEIGIRQNPPNIFYGIEGKPPNLENKE
jgi:hypothetical protein